MKPILFRLRSFTIFLFILPFICFANTPVADPMAPYHRYLQLRNSNPDDKTLITYFNEYPNQIYSKQLRKTVLDQAAKKQNWRRYRLFYRDNLGVHYDCLAIKANQTITKQSPTPEAIYAIWHRSNALPSACLPLVKTWRQQRLISSKMIWDRLAFALSRRAYPLARDLSTWLSGPLKTQAEAWLTLTKDPAAIKTLQFPLNEQGRIIATITLKQLANPKPHLVITILKQPRFKALTLQQRYDIERQIALSLATLQDPLAPALLEKLPANKKDTVINEWRIRFALTQGNWHAVLEAISRLNEHDSAKPIWRYWKARAYIALGNHTLGKQILNEIASRRQYYGFLASRDLRRPVTLFHRELPFNNSDLDYLSELPYFKQSHYFFKQGKLTEARQAFRNGILPLNDYEKYIAAKLAEQWGWHNEAITTMRQVMFQNDLQLRFPLGFQQEIDRAAKKEHIDTAFLFALIRQESAFMTDAASSRGALGLMQLLPSTASEYIATNKKLPINLALLNAKVNVKAGSEHLQEMLRQTKGQYLVVAASYNAGATAAKRWMPKASPLESAIWIETIPWKETRRYVKNIVAYYVIYQDHLGLYPNWSLIMQDVHRY